jgi:serine/threonine protein kinase
MSYCINSQCPAPNRNSSDSKFCAICGAKLRLKERYRALQLLGQGGFGKTFQAIDESQPRQPLCVIKQFACQQVDERTREMALQLFKEEAQYLETLGHHPQIPKLLDYFELEGHHYLIQEFIDGQDLEQELVDRGSFSGQQVIQLLASLLPVLDFLQGRSIPIIHRDIKPANIIRRYRDGQLVLVDFGAAKQATATILAKTGTSIGSPEFSAPEQTKGKPTFASDIFSLGVTCIFLLTQVRPFDLFDVVSDRWIWRDFLLDNPVDAALGEILDKMIANSLPQRYPSAEDVLQALGLVADVSIAHSPDQPQDAEDFFHRGVARAENNDIKGALADYGRAIALAPNFANAYYNRAVLIYKKLHDVSSAVADYNQAVALDRRFADNYYRRALFK